MATLYHPRMDEVAIESVLSALGDPMRLALVKKLASCPKGSAMNCATVAELVKDLSPSTRTHHLRILREAGIIRSEKQGVQVFNVLRKDELDGRFPGLLKGILAHI